MNETNIDKNYFSNEEIDESIFLKAKLFNVNSISPFLRVLKLYNIGIETLTKIFQAPEKQMSSIVNNSFESSSKVNIALVNKLSNFFNFTIDFFIKERIQTNIVNNNESLTYFEDNLNPVVKIEYDFNARNEYNLASSKNIYKNVYYIDFDLYIVLRSLRLIFDKFDLENETIHHYFIKKSLINDLTLNNTKLFKLAKKIPSVNIKDLEDIDYKKFNKISLFNNKQAFNFIYINKVFHPYDLRFFLTKSLPNDPLYLDILKYSMYSYLSKEDVDYLLKNHLYCDYLSKDKSINIFATDLGLKDNFSFNKVEYLEKLVFKYIDSLNDVSYSNMETINGNYLNKEMNAEDLYLLLLKRVKNKEKEM